MQQTFPTPNPIAVTVRLAGGDLTVEASDTAETVVEIVDRARGDESRLDKVRVEYRADTLIVEAPKAPWGNILDLGVSIRCPRSSTLDASTASADIRCVGPFERLKATTASGDVQAQEVAGDARVTTASGDVSLGTVGGQAAVTSASGDLDVRRAGELRASTASGDLRAGDIAGGVQVSAASGDIDVEAVGPGSVHARTASGDVTVGVKAGCDVWMDVRTLSGDVSSELESREEAPADKSRLVELKVETTSGDVRIVRAASRAE